MIKQFGWRGNVRQFQNAIRNVIVLNDGEKPTVAMLRKGLQMQDIVLTPREPSVAFGIVLVVHMQSARPDRSVSANDTIPIKSLAVVEHALNASGNNVARVAAMLEIGTSTITRLRGNVTAMAAG